MLAWSAASPIKTPRATYARTVAPSQEPISLADAKAQARIADTYSDALLATYITAAREAAEEYLGYGLFTQTWRLALDQFYDAIILPMALELQLPGLTVQYYDAAGTLQTLAPAAYIIDPLARPARLYRGPNQSWPTIQSDRLAGAVQVTYVVGWNDVADIPERIKQGIRTYLTYMDLDRDGLEVNAKEALLVAHGCWTDRVWYAPPESP